jgi:WLM domain
MDPLWESEIDGPVFSRISRGRALNLQTFPRAPNQPTSQFFTQQLPVHVIGFVDAELKMPLGWERLNTKRSTPNKNIVFIKPRPGLDENISKDYLERIAAQCLPIMNKHHLAVVSLEEYEPNHEFWGMYSRKINA